MIFPCEEDDPVRPHFEESGEEFRDIELECEGEEAREPCVLRDPGAPTESEVERHNVTHLPFGRGVLRVWRERPVTSITRVRSIRRCQKSSLTIISWGQRERTLSPFKSLGIDGPE